MRFMSTLLIVLTLAANKREVCTVLFSLLVFAFLTHGSGVLVMHTQIMTVQTDNPVRFFACCSYFAFLPFSFLLALFSLFRSLYPPLC